MWGFNPLAESENKICTRCNIARDRRCITTGWGSAESVPNWAFAAEPARTNPFFLSRLQLRWSHFSDLVMDLVWPQSAVHLFSADTSGPGSGESVWKGGPGRDSCALHASKVADRATVRCCLLIHPCSTGIYLPLSCTTDAEAGRPVRGTLLVVSEVNKNIYGNRTDSVFRVEHRNEEVSRWFQTNYTHTSTYCIELCT